MEPLLQAIQAGFAASDALVAAFPSGLWADAAPEGTAMPYVVQTVVEAPIESCYGSAARAAARVEFCVYAIGRAPALALAETLAATLRDALLTLSAGQNYDARQATDPAPTRAGRDASVADDAAQGDVYAVRVTFEFAVRRA